MELIANTILPRERLLAVDQGMTPLSERHRDGEGND